jgi:hypothetical protein
LTEFGVGFQTHFRLQVLFVPCLALIHRSFQDVVPVNEIAGCVPSSCATKVTIVAASTRTSDVSVAKANLVTAADRKEAPIVTHTKRIPPPRLSPYLPAFTDGTSREVHLRNKATDHAVSAALPGAIVIDPVVREIVQSQGMKISENAVWLFVVAVKEFAKSIVNKAVQSKEAIRKHRVRPYSPLQAILSKPNAKAKQTASKKDSSDKKSSVKGNLELEQNNVISVADLSLVAGTMPMSSIDSLGGTVSRLSFERCTFAPLNTTQILKGVAFDDVHSFLTTQLWAASLERQKALKVQGFTSKSSASQKPSISDVQHEAATAKKDDFSVPKPPTKTNTTVPDGSTARSLIPRLGRGGKNLGLGRGAKNLAALMARTAAVAANRSSTPAPATHQSSGSAPAVTASVTAQDRFASAADGAPTSTSINLSTTALSTAAASVVPAPAPALAPSLAPSASTTATAPATDQPAATPEKKGNPNQVVRRGRGLGKKNLAFMRARVVKAPEEALTEEKAADSPAPATESLGQRTSDTQLATSMGQASLGSQAPAAESLAQGNMEAQVSTCQAPKDSQAPAPEPSGKAQTSMSMDQASSDSPASVQEPSRQGTWESATGQTPLGSEAHVPKPSENGTSDDQTSPSMAPATSGPQALAPESSGQGTSDAPISMGQTSLTSQADAAESLGRGKSDGQVSMTMAKASLGSQAPAPESPGQGTHDAQSSTEQAPLSPRSTAAEPSGQGPSGAQTSDVPADQPPAPQSSLCRTSDVQISPDQDPLGSEAPAPEPSGLGSSNVQMCRDQDAQAPAPEPLAQGTSDARASTGQASSDSQGILNHQLPESIGEALNSEAALNGSAVACMSDDGQQVRSPQVEIADLKEPI